MGTLVCPLCCDEEFSSQLSLKYHLLSITDNMYCPECNKRFDSILQLANHLDGTCGKSSISDTNERDEEIIEKEKDHKETSLIDKEMVKPVQQIHEMKTYEAIEARDVGHYLSDPDTPMVVEVEYIGPSDSQSNESESNPENIATKNQDMEQHEDPPKNNESFRDIEQSAVKDDCEDVASGTLESQSIEMEEAPVVTEQFACSSCDFSFSSIVEHIQMYHTGQEVMIDVPGANNDVLSKLVAGADSNVAIENGKNNTPVEEGRSIESQETSVIHHKERSQPIKKHEIIRPFSLFKEKSRTISNGRRIKQIVRQPKKIFKRVENSEFRYVSKEVKIEKFWEKQHDEKRMSTPASKETILNRGIKKEMINFQLKKNTRTSLERLFSDDFMQKGSGGPETRPGPNLGVNRIPEVKFIISPGEQGVGNTISVYTCSTCQKEFGNISAFEKHSCTVAKFSSLVCKICNVEFADTKNMQSHMQDVHGVKLGKSPGPIRCPSCNVIFTSVRALKQHEKTHKPIEVKVSLECPVSLNVGSSNRTLNQHMKIHSNILYIKKDDEELVEESNIETEKQELPNFQVCKVCCKTFPNIEDLRAHWQEHAAQKEGDENIEGKRLTDEASDSLKDDKGGKMQNKKNTEPSTQCHKEIDKSFKEVRSKYHAWLPM